MMDLGAVIEVVQAVNTLGKLNKEVGAMVSETGNRNNHGSNGKGALGATRVIARGRASVQPAADFSDLYEESPRKSQSANKAPACYHAAMERMAELGRLQASVEYHARLKDSKTMQAVEQRKKVLYNATSHGLLRAFHRLVPEPVQPLEALVVREIEVMAAMQRQVGLAVDHSEGIVGKLRSYDSDLMKEFDSAKTELAERERKYAKTQKTIEARSKQLSQTQMDSMEYVPVQTKLNNLLRAEKETKNSLEILGQQVVDTYKQSSQVRAQEDVVRMALHELRLVNSSVTRVLTYVRRTRQADELLPQLVETATVVTDSYQILTGIVAAGSVGTTDAVKKLVSVIGTVDYRRMPTIQREVNKQRSMLEKADKKTTYYEQAVELLRGKNYQAASAAEEIATAAPLAA